MPEYSSGQVSIGGLGNGQDWTEMIDALKKIELRHANQLGRWRDDWQKRIDGFASLRTTLTDYSTFLKTMNTKDKFMTKDAAISDPAVAKITNSDGAMDGSYTLEVKQLATNSFASVGTTVAKKLDPITDSQTTFTYTYGKDADAVTRTLDIGAGTTLEGLKNIINNDKNNPGVTATIVDAGGEFFLQLYSKEMGDGTDIAVTKNTTFKFDFGTEDLDGDGIPDGDWQTQPGQNAQIKWNGFPAEADKWYTFKSNSFNMYGLGITLQKPTPAGEPVTVTVNTDTGKIKENVQKFVEETNKVRSAILDLTSVNQEKSVKDPEYATSQFEMQKGNILTGNYGVQLISSMFKEMTMAQGLGFEYLTINSDSSFTGDLFSSLAQIGIKTDTVQGSATFGLLIYEENEKMMTLDKALELSPEGVAELFAANKQGYCDTTDFMVYDTLDGFTTAGKWNIEYDIRADGSINPDTIKIDGVSGVAKIDEDGLIFVHDNSHPAAGLRILAVNRNEGHYSATARVKDGKVGELVNLVDNKFLKAYNEDPLEEKGILSILERQYDKIKSNIEDKIAKEGERLVKWERNIKLRFARLDETLKKYDNLNSQLESQIKQLGNNSSK